MRLLTPLFGLGLIASAATSPAIASISTSADCLQTPRVVSVMSKVAAACTATGTGSLRGINDAFRADNIGWVQLDSSDPGIMKTSTAGWLTGELSGFAGSFAVDAAAYAAYDHLALGFQSGGSSSDPDWVAFELADMTLEGRWSISAHIVGHMVLYGMNDTLADVVAVPEPTSLALAGIAMAGLGVTRRRRRQA